jgi:glycosyltransferase involved in cell wall biosynthesis
MRLIFAIPGDLESLTGGYRYDREVMARLADFGVSAVVLQLPGSFPNLRPGDLDEAVRAVNATLLPGDAVLMDGLAYGVFSQNAIAAINAPIVALCHHPLGLETGFGPERSQALLASEKKALALASHVIVTSAHTARIMGQDFGVSSARITIAPPGTEPACRAEGSDESLSLLAVGSITPRKAFDVLIEALASLTDLDWSLKIVGAAHHSPETAAALAKLIRARGLGSRVECLGELEGAALDAVFHRSSIFVSTSLYEGYGMALAEAMARGLPVIASTGGAAAETVPDAAALKIPPGDVAALRGALRSVMADPILRRRLSEASWQAGQELPSWKETAEAVARVVKEVTQTSQ